MSFCTECGRQILDETKGCPVCNAGKAQETPWTDFNTRTEDTKAEKVDAFTVEDGQGNSHRFETNEETGHAEYQSKTKVASEATIHPALKVLVIVLIVMVGGLGAIAGCVAGVVLSKSPSEDYRNFGRLMMKVSIVMLVVSFVCCGVSAGMGILGNLFGGGSAPQISY